MYIDYEFCNDNGFLLLRLGCCWRSNHMTILTQTPFHSLKAPMYSYIPVHIQYM
jgi:hypothetical protein